MRRNDRVAASPLERALWVVAAALVLGLAGAAVLVASGPLGGIELAYGYLALAALNAAAGLLAWWRRPANRLGLLLVLNSGAWLVGGLQNTGVPVLIAAGMIVSTLPLSTMIHLLHGYPSGRLDGALSRATVVGAYVVGTLLQAPLWAFTAGPPPYDLLTVSDRPDLALAGFRVQQVCGVLVVLATVWVLVGRLRAFDSGHRRRLAPLLAYGVLAVVTIPVGEDLVRPVVGDAAYAVELLVVAGLPLLFVAAVVRGGFVRTGELGEFVDSVVSSRSSDLGRAVASTLGDPSAVLLRWSAEAGTLVDLQGRPVTLPEPGGRRAAVQVEVGERGPVVVVHDPALNPDPAPVAAVARVAAIAIEREALAEEAATSRRALQEASSRLLAGGDRERRRLARDLHDGLQVSLLRLSMQAHQLAADLPRGQRDLAARMASDVDDAAASLRSLVHGVMPAPLVERGLPAAVQDLAHGLPVLSTLTVTGLTDRLAPGVESAAYFVVSEALANVVKHSSARHVDIGLHRDGDWLSIEVCDDGDGATPGAARAEGTGLRGLQDRLEVLGGTLDVTRLPTGTRLSAALPCATS